MLNDNSAASFEALEKQLAKDALEKALKDLHGEITQEIDRNKSSFTREIQSTLANFKESLERNVSEEIDQKISALFEKHFQNVSGQVTSSFDQMFSPVLKETEDDMQRLRVQGEATLRSWEAMMAQYKGIWARPFFLMFFASVFTGIILSLVSSYFLGKAQGELIQQYEKKLLSYESTILEYYEREQARPTALMPEKLKANSNQPKMKAPHKKKTSR